MRQRASDIYLFIEYARAITMASISEVGSEKGMMKLLNISIAETATYVLGEVLSFNYRKDSGTFPIYSAFP